MHSGFAHQLALLRKECVGAVCCIPLRRTAQCAVAQHSARHCNLPCALLRCALSAAALQVSAAERPHSALEYSRVRRYVPGPHFERAHEVELDGVVALALRHAGKLVQVKLQPSSCSFDQQHKAVCSQCHTAQCSPLTAVQLLCAAWAQWLTNVPLCVDSIQFD